MRKGDTGQSIEMEVKELVAKHLAVRCDQLTLDTRLLHDVGADGADGWELIEELGKRFGVDLSEFRPGLHFGPEAGCNPVLALIALAFRPHWSKFIPITIRDMVEAAQSGKWKTPNREPV